MRGLIQVCSSAGLLALGPLGLTGCDSGGATPGTPQDGATQNEGTTGDKDGTAGDTKTDGTGEIEGTVAEAGPTETGGEVATTDPCKPGACKAAVAPTCDGEKATSTPAEVCENDNGAAKCTPATSVVEDCAATGNLCKNGQCVTPCDPSTYKFSDAVSYIYRLELSKDCCYDFNGDGKTDNVLGSLLSLLASQGVDINAQLKDSIEGTPEKPASLVLLFEEWDLADPVTDPEFTIKGYLGADPDKDFANNLSGTHSFQVDAQKSFIEGSCASQIHFGGAKLSSGELEAGPAVFALPRTSPSPLRRA
jgi:hypothetical protein